MSSEEFPRTLLGDVVTFVNGDRGKAYPKESDYQTHGIPFISAADITNGRLDIGSAKKISREKFNEIRNGKVQSGDLLYCLRGSIGKSALVAEAMEGAIASSLVIIRGSDRADVKYVRYFLESTEGKSASLSLDNGSAQPNVSVRELSAVKIPLPTMEVQREIVGTLGSLDDRIDNLRATNATLEAITQAIFKSWFIDFDPVRAKMEGREPEGMDAETAALFPREFEESELGLIPKGWNVKRLSQCLVESREKIGEAPAPEYSSTNEGLLPRADRFKKSLSRTSDGNKRIEKGYFVFGLSRERLNFGAMHDPIGSVSSAYAVFRFVHESLSFDFLERQIRMRHDYFYQAVSTAAREGQGISKDALLSLAFCDPPSSLYEAYRAFSGLILERLKQLEHTVGTLSTLRDELLPRLISGKLRIEEAKAETEVVA